jgi:CDP-diacylglycerol--glycerol-3-phosphate 3-phosphatidyltransferase
MTKHTEKSNWLTIPNVISLLRIASVPVLLILAWNQFPITFLVLFAIALATDALDGYLARKLNQITELGTKLDTWGDTAMYFTAPICGYWLWPDLVNKDLITILIFWIGFIIPIIFSVSKFGRMPSYHTILAKINTILLSFAVLIWFVFSFPWIFRFAVLIELLIMIEYIAITIYLKEWRGNIPSYWHATGRFGNNK